MPQQFTMGFLNYYDGSTIPDGTVVKLYNFADDVQGTPLDTKTVFNGEIETSALHTFQTYKCTFTGSGVPTGPFYFVVQASPVFTVAFSNNVAPAPSPGNGVMMGSGATLPLTGDFKALFLCTADSSLWVNTSTNVSAANWIRVSPTTRLAAGQFSTDANGLSYDAYGIPVQYGATLYATTGGDKENVLWVAGNSQYLPILASFPVVYLNSALVGPGNTTSIVTIHCIADLSVVVSVGDSLFASTPTIDNQPVLLNVASVSQAPTTDGNAINYTLGVTIDPNYVYWTTHTLNTDGNGPVLIVFPGGLRKSTPLPPITAFPSTPVAGQQAYRSDLNALCYYDGTFWHGAYHSTASVDFNNVSIADNTTTYPAVVTGSALTITLPERALVYEIDIEAVVTGDQHLGAIALCVSSADNSNLGASNGLIQSETLTMNPADPNAAVEYNAADALKSNYSTSATTARVRVYTTTIRNTGSATATFRLYAATVNNAGTTLTGYMIARIRSL